MRALLAATLMLGTALSACSGVDPIETGSSRAGADVRIERDVKVGGQTKQSVGSGVYIGNGIILTAAHVVDGAKEVRVKSDAGDIQTATVLWTNAAYDLAAIRPTNSRRFKEARLACVEPHEGDEVKAAGNPAGIEFVTMHGYVSGKSRKMAPDWEAVFLTDMTTIGGMSGGGVYNREGYVVGITVGTLGYNAPAGGLGFAVPGKVACQMLGRAA
jgi:serine protease Do